MKVQVLKLAQHCSNPTLDGHPSDSEDDGKDFPDGVSNESKVEATVVRSVGSLRPKSSAKLDLLRKDGIPKST